MAEVDVVNETLGDEVEFERVVGAEVEVVIDDVVVVVELEVFAALEFSDLEKMLKSVNLPSCYKQLDVIETSLVTVYIQNPTKSYVRKSYA